MTLLALVDVLLLAGLTARLTRFVVTDDLGGWMIRHPIHRFLVNHTGTWRTDKDPVIYYDNVIVSPPWQEKITRLFHCPWCIGSWLAAGCALSLYVAGGPGHAAEWWRYLAGVFALNYVVAHVGVRLGDTDGDAG